MDGSEKIGSYQKENIIVYRERLEERKGVNGVINIKYIRCLLVMIVLFLSEIII